LLLNDIAIGAATATLTGGNFGTPTTAIYLTFDYDVAAKYEVKLATVAGANVTGMSHVSGANVAHTAGCKIGRMINAEVIDDIVSGSTLLTPLADGWVKPTGTWAKASASSITVPSGAASLYSVGDKIKLTDTTTKYFYVTAVADTVLTITGGTDYALVGTISNYYYSKASSPVGFPLNGFAAATNQRISMNGGRFEIRGWSFITGNGSGIVKTVNVTLPVTFTNLPYPQGSSLGYKDVSDPTTVGDFASAGSGGQLAVVVSGTTTSQISITLTKLDNTNIENGRRCGFSWLVIGN
jgi:hypothetical protein